MNFSIQSLHFSPTPTLFVTGLVVMALMGGLSAVMVKRSVHPRRTAGVETLRLLATLVGVLFLWKPEWRTVLHPETRPRIMVLTDVSGSMSTADAETPEGEVVSRRERVQQLLTPEFLEQLSAGGANEVIQQEICAAVPDEPLSGTDLTTPLIDLLEAENHVRAVLLLSDGDDNLGQPPVVAAQKMLQRGIPLFAVPIGTEQRLPDLDLIAVNAPTYGIVGENVQIPFTIRSSLDREVRTTLRLTDGTGRSRTKEVVLLPGVENYESILWRIQAEGSSTLTLEVPFADGERVRSNNRREFNLTGRPESIKVLVIDSLPRWEYRYLRNALSRDPGVELSCLLFHPDLGLGQGPDYLSAFPSKPEELATYDVIMMGDVGVKDGQLTTEQCTMIAGLVENQASGIVFLPGEQGNQASLLDTPLGDLMPVIPDAEQPQGIVDPTPSPLELTGEGRSSLLTLLADTEEANPEVWASLPGFTWHSAVSRAKGGAQVLAVHSNRRTQYGPTPIIVTATAGSGKVLYMGIDSAWRWRRGVEDKYHYRFWGQVARWMSYQRNMAQGQRIRLYYSPERPEPGNVVSFHANAFASNGAPLEEGEVILDAESPEGETHSISLTKSDASWGAYSGKLRITQPGQWNISAHIAGEPDSQVETRLLAQGVELEKIGQPARPQVLEELARITRGRWLPPQRLGELTHEVRALPEPRPIENRIPLWSHWLPLTLLISLLSAFWIARKWNGTI
ncbi:hypothetical protein HNR46_002917 [Haloferula luteola]|uniref:VWFA domain-containing protein n=1 Tax=Haloferula luteola TaxID=595692 RepID=A0A840VFS4_9BACT|nr:hypothetical protein [Haloferula luteola]MBB5352669.1 hypothetical protein [Haloferula luteola]